MYDEVDTMYDDENEDWSVVKFSTLSRLIEKIRGRYSLPLTEKGLFGKSR